MAYAPHTTSRSGRRVKSHNYARVDESGFDDHDSFHDGDGIPDSLLSYPEDINAGINSSYQQLLDDIHTLGLGTDDRLENDHRSHAPHIPPDRYISHQPGSDLHDPLIDPSAARDATEPPPL